jgi:hypothetical protein
MIINRLNRLIVKEIGSGRKMRPRISPEKELYMLSSIIWIMVGAFMFIRFREAQKAQRRIQAIIWMVSSAFFSIFGVLGLLGSILN